MGDGPDDVFELAALLGLKFKQFAVLRPVRPLQRRHDFELPR